MVEREVAVKSYGDSFRAHSIKPQRNKLTAKGGSVVRPGSMRLSALVAR